MAGGFASAFLDYDIDILNSRREHFDETITQNADDPEFKKQVEWEQRGLNLADIIAFYFDPKTESPISLLELGLFAHSHKIFVCCPKCFWKAGNVDLICDENNIPRFETMEELITAVKTQVEKLMHAGRTL